MSTEREKQILEILLKEKKVSVPGLAKVLFVSEPSIRRDLQSLEKKNLIKRVHGGAILEENALSKNKIPFLIREYEQSSAKALIAQKAIRLIDMVFAGERLTEEVINSIT
jgi:DeoR/GlpR family transcriptional regulator of sugar metabolism